MKQLPGKCDTKIIRSEEYLYLSDLHLPNYKEIEYFEYRNQFFDSDAFRDIESWSKRYFSYLNSFNKQVEICHNKLVDTVLSKYNHIESSLGALQNKIDQDSVKDKRSMTNIAFWLSLINFIILVILFYLIFIK